MRIMKDELKNNHTNKHYIKGLDYYKKQEFNSARIFLTKAVKKNSIDALVLIGRMYKEGQGYKRSYKKAFNFFEQGFELGSEEAELELADFYMNGYIYPKNINKALKIYEKYLTSHSMANVIMGEYIEKNLNSKEEYEQVISYYSNALRIDESNQIAKKALELMKLEGINNEIIELESKIEKINQRIKTLSRKQIILWSLAIFVVSSVFVVFPALDAGTLKQEHKKVLKDKIDDLKYLVNKRTIISEFH